MAQSLAEMEPELLQATIAALDAWDADSGGAHVLTPQLDLHKSPRSPPPPATTQTRHGSKPSTRDRRRAEIRVLALELQELERTREELRERLEGAVLHDTPTRVIWRAIAERQAELRREAEIMNARLREWTTDQSRIAQMLVRLVRRSERLMTDELAMRPTPSVLNLSEKVSDESQIRRLGVVHSRSALADKTLPREIVFNEIEVNTEVNATGTTFDIHSTWVFPFSASKVERALWDSFLCFGDERGSEVSLMTREYGSDVKVAVFAGPDSDDCCGCNGKLALKRSPGVVVSTIHAAPTFSVGNVLAGYVCQEDAWFRVQSCPTNGKTVSIVEVCRQTSVTVDATGRKIPMKTLDVVAEHTLSGLEEDMTWRKQNLENALLRVLS